MVGKEKKGGVKLSNSNFFKFNQNPTNITDSQYHTKFQDLLKYLKENITENKKKGDSSVNRKESTKVFNLHLFLQ